MEFCQEPFLAWQFPIPDLGLSVLKIREGNGNPLQYSCLENPMDRGAWQVAVHRVAKSRTRLSNFTLTFHFPAMEKEMSTHSNILAWRISGMAEPGGLLSMGLHRVGHDRNDAAAAAAAAAAYIFKSQLISSSYSSCNEVTSFLRLSMIFSLYYGMIAKLCLNAHHFCRWWQFLGQLL